MIPEIKNEVLDLPNSRYNILNRLPPFSMEYFFKTGLLIFSWLVIDCKKIRQLLMQNHVICIGKTPITII